MMDLKHFWRRAISRVARETLFREMNDSAAAQILTCTAKVLDDMGVDIIEAGFPIASEGDFAAVSEIAKNSVNSVICGLARANFADIDRCWEAVKHAEKPRIHTFIGTSPLHRAIPNLTMDEMAERIEQTVTHARNLCDNVQWSPMDATRTEWD